MVPSCWLGLNHDTGFGRGIFYMLWEVLGMLQSSFFHYLSLTAHRWSEDWRFSAKLVTLSKKYLWDVTKSRCETFFFLPSFAIGTC